jgi:hypothetical protein
MPEAATRSADTAATHAFSYCWQLPCPPGTKAKACATGALDAMGRPTGTYQIHFQPSDTTRVLVLQVTWDDSSRPATVKRWYTDGKPMVECTFAHGKLNGTATYWYTTGDRWEEWHWKAGMREGMYTRWYRDGEVIQQREYQADTVAKDMSPHLSWINFTR